MPRCPRCGDPLLDLDDGIDRAIVRTYVDGATRTRIAFGTLVPSLALLPILFTASSAPYDVVALGLVGLFLVPLALSRVAGASVLRRAGLDAHDIRSRRAIRVRRTIAREVATSVPLAIVVVAVLVHFGRVWSDSFDRALSIASITLFDRVGLVTGGGFLGRAARLGDAFRFAFDAIGVLAFGIPVEMRVRRVGTLLVFAVATVTAATVEMGLAHVFAGGVSLGIGAGAYAFLVVPAVLDPHRTTTVPLFHSPFEGPAYQRAIVMLAMWSALDASFGPVSIVLPRLAGAAAGMLVAIPLRAIPPRASYADYRAHSERVGKRLG